MNTNKLLDVTNTENLSWAKNRLIQLGFVITGVYPIETSYYQSGVLYEIIGHKEVRK